MWTKTADEIVIPKDFPVQPLKPGENPPGKTTCGTCGLSWDDDLPTTWTPTPSGRCPFEYFHVDVDDEVDPDSLSGIAQQLRLIADQLDSAPGGEGLDGIISELDKIGVVLSNY